MKLRRGIIRAAILLGACLGGLTAGPASCQEKKDSQPLAQAELLKYASLELVDAALVQPGGRPVPLSPTNPARIQTRPGANLRVRVELRIHNVGSQPIRQVFISYSGPVFPGIRPFLPVGGPIAAGKSHSEELHLTYLGGNQGEEEISALLVAVELEDKTVIGDTKAVAEYRAARHAQLLPQSPQIEKWNGKILDPVAAEVVSARYGAGESWVDVTEVVQDIGTNVVDPITVRVGPRNLQCDDPATGVEKILEVAIEVSGKTYVVSAPDRSILTVGHPGAIEEYVGASGEPFIIGDWEVIAAWYGVDNRWIDVLGSLRLQVRDGSIDLHSIAALSNDDPARGVPKTLRLYYREGDAARVAVYKDKARFVIPTSAAERIAGLDEIQGSPRPRDREGTPFSVHRVEEAMFGPSAIEVVKAHYGLEETVVDVTDVVREMFANPDGAGYDELIHYVIRVTNVDINRLRERGLALSVTVDGSPHDLWIKDRERIVLGAPGSLRARSVRSLNRSRLGTCASLPHGTVWARTGEIQWGDCARDSRTARSRGESARSGQTTRPQTS